MTIRYVDDLLVFAKEDREIEHFKKRIRMDFALKDLGKPRQFLNMEIDWTNSDVVVLSQSRLIEK